MQPFLRTISKKSTPFIWPVKVTKFQLRYYGSIPNQFEPPAEKFTLVNPKLNKQRKIINAFYFGAAMGLLYSLYAYNNTLNKNKFTPSTQDLLKQALWKESEKEKFNYAKALKLYTKALDECKTAQLDELSDEYTGIELKIADMCQRLGRFEDVHSIYSELLYKFFNALSTPDVVSEEKRGALIRKDLRVLIKSLETNNDLSLGRRNLLAHLLLAQEEVLRKSPELKEYFEKRKEKSLEESKGVSQEQFDFKTFVNEENIKVDKDGYMIVDIFKNSTAWEPFKEEFFTARDLYTAYCLSAKDLAAALGCKMTTLEWMVMADMPPAQILLSQANLGSLFYLQAEKFASQSETYKNQLNEFTEGSTESHQVALNLRKNMENHERSLNMSIKCYEGVIDFAKKNKKLRFKMKEELDPSVSQAIALATYGIGILSVQKGLLAKAENLLKESISLANDTGFVELLSEATSELEKLQTQKQTESYLI